MLIKVLEKLDYPAAVVAVILLAAWLLLFICWHLLQPAQCLFINNFVLNIKNKNCRLVFKDQFDLNVYKFVLGHSEA